MKISNFIFPVIFLILLGYFYSLPWATPIEIRAKSQEGSVTLTLLRPNNEQIFRDFDLSKTQLPIELAGVRIRKVHFTAANSLTVNADGSSYVFDETHNPEIPSSRNQRKVIVSIIIVSFLLTCLLYFIVHFISSLERKKVFIVGAIFCIHFGAFSAWLYHALPGYYTYDSFQYLYDANIYYLSDFTGWLFSSAMMVLYQTLPFEWILPLVNIFVISFCLTYLFSLSYKRNLLGYYFLACVGFYLWPASIPFNLFAIRDVSSHWILAFTLIYMSVYFLERKQDLRSTLNLVFLFSLSTFLRQESIYLLIFALLILSYCYQRNKVRFFALVSVVLFAINFFTTNYTHRFERSKSALVYKSTILINQLSYILRNQYGHKLPEEVDKELGHFFKNQYLLDYQSDFEINPFHRGGVNSDFSPEDYDQFQSAALKIFAENPRLFLKNRINMARMMLGFGHDSGSVLFNVYHDEGKFYLRIKDLLGLRNYNERARLIDNIETHFHQGSELFYHSYLIPLILLAILGLLSLRSPVFLILLSVLALRTLLVFLTGPADLFKYNYILWILAFFGIPILMLERRSNIDNKRVSV